MGGRHTKGTLRCDDERLRAVLLEKGEIRARPNGKVTVMRGCENQPYE